MRGRIRAACLAAWAASAVPAPAAAWDFPGHRIVGAIADLVLQQYHPATQQRVSELLQKNDGGSVQKRSLSEVAVFPDCAKKGNVPFCGRPPPTKRKRTRSAIRTMTNSTSPMCRCSNRATSPTLPARKASMPCR